MNSPDNIARTVAEDLDLADVRLLASSSRSVSFTADDEDGRALVVRAELTPDRDVARVIAVPLRGTTVGERHAWERERTEDRS